MLCFKLRPTLARDTGEGYSLSRVKTTCCRVSESLRKLLEYLGPSQHCQGQAWCHQFTAHTLCSNFVFKLKKFVFKINKHSDHCVLIKLANTMWYLNWNNTNPLCSCDHPYNNDCTNRITFRPLTRPRQEKNRTNVTFLGILILFLKLIPQSQPLIAQRSVIDTFP